MFEAPVLTRNRIRLAYAVAIAADALQLLLGPFGWTFADEIIDIIAMILTWRTIGFHPLLLPTFVVEFIPVFDMLPTWTACVALVVSLRKKPQEPKTPPREGPVIDV
jgi:hypothetical protein